MKRKWLCLTLCAVLIFSAVPFFQEEYSYAADGDLFTVTITAASDSSVAPVKISSKDGVGDGGDLTDGVVPELTVPFEYGGNITATVDFTGAVSGASISLGSQKSNIIPPAPSASASVNFSSAEGTYYGEVIYQNASGASITNRFGVTISEEAPSGPGEITVDGASVTYQDGTWMSKVSQKATQCTIGCSGGTITSVAVDGVTASNPVLLTAPIHSLTVNWMDGSGQTKTTNVIVYKENAYQVSVGGSVYSPVPLGHGAFECNVSISQATVNITATDNTGNAPSPETIDWSGNSSMGQVSVNGDTHTFPGPGTYSGNVGNGKLSIVITYTAPSPGGGGGGGGGGSVEKEPEINVTNETNEPNQSSDTILIPGGTQEKDGTSTTDVSDKEVDALLELVEKHEEDVPEGENEAIIEIEDQKETGCDTYEVNLTEKDVEKIVESSADILSVRTSVAEFRIRNEELGQQKKSGKGGGISIRLSRFDNEGRPGVDAVLLEGEAVLTTFGGVYPLEIRIPYEKKEEEEVPALCIEYITEEGERILITESWYDQEKQCLVFFATHLSKYGVSYKPASFRDVKASHWANSYITFLAARRVITGMDDGSFQPDRKVTKAEFITMMTQAFSTANLGSKTVRSYQDVPLDSWYAKAVGWSYLNNISTVIAKGGRLYPEQALSREDMAALSNNISLGLGLRLRQNQGSIAFTDQQSISGYALPGVQRMVSCGVVSGTSNGRFMPKNGLTRAEAAKVISTLMSKMK